MPQKMLKDCKTNPRKLYDVWRHMKSRCNNSKDEKNYKNYGGRGIRVCKEWEESFSTFRDWAYENGWNEDNMYISGRNRLSIDRIDNNGNYCPENCRITTYEIQSYNKRNTVYINYQGKKYTSKDLSKLLGITQKTLISRVRKGIDEKDLIKKYRQVQREYVKKFEYNGEKYTYNELAEISGLSRKCIYQRIYIKGWTIKDAVETPLKGEKMNIKKIRLNVNLTQWEFAKQIGVSTAAVRKWEQGKSEPRPKAQKKIVDFCKKNGIAV